MSNSPPKPAFETTLHVRDHCLCLHAQRAARALARQFDEALRPLGLTSGQFSLMMALNRPEPPTLGMVADTLAMDRTTLTAAVKPLDRRGLVAAATDPKDRRSRRLALTEAGRAVLGQAVEVWTRTHAAIDGMLDEAGARDAAQGLRRLSGLLQPPR
jgi:DNA-binding MarR family transcriptional regulator